MMLVGYPLAVNVVSKCCSSLVLRSSVEQYPSALCLSVVRVMIFSLHAWAVVKCVYLSEAEGFLDTVVWIPIGDLITMTSRKGMVPSCSISLLHLIVGCMSFRYS